MILDLEQSQIRFKQPVKPADPDDVEDVGNPQLDDSDIKSIQDLVPGLISMMEAVGRREDFVKKLKSIADKTLDIQNIALSLLLDIGQFLNCNTVNSMRYHQTSLDFWSVFHKIFRGKGIRFMRGLKASKVDLVLDPENFQIALKPAILQLHACNFVPSRASDRYLGQHLKFFGIKA